MAWLSPDCRGSFARVFPLDDVPVGYRPVARRQAKHGLERDMSIKSSDVAEDEFVQVRIDVLTAETMVGAEAPPLQEGEGIQLRGTCPARLPTTRGSWR